MKLKVVLFIGCVLAFCFSFCEAKGNGYSKPRNYTKGGTIKLQKGYLKKSSGKYVTPHLKTNSDQYKFNNLKK
jgi:hypothetical protein